MERLNYLLNEVKSGAYLVVKGDTLDSIATNFNTTKRLIMLDNFLSEEVEVGSVIYVKCYSVIHVVNLGETIEEIACLYGVTKEEILSLNKTSFIHPYMKLVIK
ncbi:MAG: LysM peptidoglycan-binding domain-containing protein [Clostridia bacterium]|nr:LysM peptidoglycan-binding domain-containing protein [Clostridia bacterium]